MDGIREKLADLIYHSIGWFEISYEECLVIANRLVAAGVTFKEK